MADRDNGRDESGQAVSSLSFLAEKIKRKNEKVPPKSTGVLPGSEDELEKSSNCG